MEHGEVAMFRVAGRRGRWREDRQSQKLVVLPVEEVARSQNVAGREVNLNFGEVSDSPKVIVIGALGQFGNDVVLKFPINTLKEPDPAFAYRAGDGDTRNDLVEGESVLHLERGKKVCGREAVVVIADASRNAEYAAGTFSVLG